MTKKQKKNFKQKIQKINTFKDQETYFFSQATKRIIVRFCDLFFLIAINFIFIVLILINRSGKSFVNNWNYLVNQPLKNVEFFPWRIFVMWLYIFAIYFIYFILIVKWTGGYTLFGRFWKIRLINDTTDKSKIKLKIWQLFKKEFVVLFLSIVVNLLFSFIILVWKPKENGLLIILTVFNKNLNQNFGQQIFSAIFSAIFGFSFLIQFIYFIGMIFYSRKVTWQDSAGNLLVIDYSDSSINKYKEVNWKKFRTQINYKNRNLFPGADLKI